MKGEKLGEIFSISKGRKHSIADVKTPGSKRIIGIADLRNDHDLVYTNDKKGTEVTPEDILLAWDGANAGTIGFGKKGLIGSTIARLRFKKLGEYNTAFIGIFLKTQFEYLRRTATGATIPHVSRSALESINIPKFNKDDQIRIATLLSRVEALIAKRKENLGLLDELLKSTFLEMFGDPVRNENGWGKIKIKEIAQIRIGPFGSLLHACDYVENGVPLINPSHIIQGKIVPDYYFSLSREKYLGLTSYHLKKNDVVVARRGEIGRCAIMENDEPLFCGTGSMFIRIHNEYSPILLQFQIYNTSLRRYLESKAKGVTMKNLNSTVLGNQEILNIPPALQNKFVAITRQVEFLKNLYQHNLNDLENLYGILSQKAFKGKLDLSRIPLPTITADDHITAPLPSIRGEAVTGKKMVSSDGKGKIAAATL